VKGVLYHLQFNVSDAARSIPFYRDCLRWLGFDW
jgi:catechol 2,3-dioxygenase-like lactoylglutathione lyase family enzyme